MKYIVFGYGDIGKRIANALLEQNKQVVALTRTLTQKGKNNCIAMEEDFLDLDCDINALPSLKQCHQAYCFYLIPPQKSGLHDNRSQTLIAAFKNQHIHPKKMVLISTTAVYGDCLGQWIDEKAPINPSSDRGYRRLNSERSWQQYCNQYGVDLVVLRVPGIYAYSRLPFERIKKATPVVSAKQSGFTNRIHADDLTQIAILTMHHSFTKSPEFFNVSDGMPSTISHYLQTIAKEFGYPALKEISLEEAKLIYSDTLLSYILDSRKINSQKILSIIDYQLKYPNFIEGIKFG